MHFFRVRMNDYYTVAVEGTIDEAERELKNCFADVKYIRTSDDKDSAKRCRGHRKLGNIIIKGCYFSGSFGVKSC